MCLRGRQAEEEDDGASDDGSGGGGARDIAGRSGTGTDRCCCVLRE
jgi:hypothetical protein